MDDISLDSQFFEIDGNDVARLRAVMRRLFSEDRMSADEMRDAAQALEIVVRHAEDFPVASTSAVRDADFYRGT